MKKHARRTLCFSLTALLVFGAAGVAASAADAGVSAGDKDAFFHATAYEYGPGIDNLSTADEYARYQWGLRNEGDLEYVEVVNLFDYISPLLARLIDFGNWAHLDLPADLRGPDVYRMETTRAVSGMDINIEPAWEQYDADTSLHRPVTVAVIDTGIDYTHPEIADAMWTNIFEIPGDGIDNDGNGYIDDIHGWNFFHNNNQTYVGEEDDHGTHAAGTIAAKRGNGGIAGIADPAYVKIMSLKVLGTDYGIGEEDAVVNAIHYAEAMGASICNLSFGSEYNFPKLEEAIRDSNMLFILAAGNGDFTGRGVDLDMSRMKEYPACYNFDNTITVANLMFDGNLDYSSNYGYNNVDIAAPGTFILSLCAGNGYAYMSGTSMSAPMVAGVAAMVYSYRPEFSLADVRNAILNTAKKTDSLAGKVKTGGIVDAYAAMNYGRLMY